MSPNFQQTDSRPPYTISQLTAMVEGVTGRMPERSESITREVVAYGDTLAATGAAPDTTLILGLVSKNNDYVITAADWGVLATGGPGGIDIRVPTAVGVTGQVHFVKKIDAGAGSVHVLATGAETIDGAAEVTLDDRYDAVTVISDGANWQIVCVVP